MSKFPKIPTELAKLVDPNLRGAACKNMAPLFDPREEGESAAEAESRYHRARNVCRTCPVRARCAEAVLAIPKGQQLGIWGGRVYTATKPRKAAA